MPFAARVMGQRTVRWRRLGATSYLAIITYLKLGRTGLSGDQLFQRRPPLFHRPCPRS